MSCRLALAYGYGSKDEQTIPSNLQQQYAEGQSANWDSFYSEKQDSFFKDRHWIWREFPAVMNVRCLLALGCGVGNAVLPLMKHRSADAELRVFATDFSATAVALLASKGDSRLTSFVSDMSDSDAVVRVVGGDKQEAIADGITLIFALSAVADQRKRAATVRTCAQALQRGGLVFFRDYFDGDERMVSFDERPMVHKVDTRTYVRGDGTYAVFFTETELHQLFCANGEFKVIRSEVVERAIENRQQKITMQRKWIQIVFERL